MLPTNIPALFLLLSCASPETQAGDVALKYASLALDDHGGRHTLACPEDREAKSVDRIKGDYDAAKGGLFGGLVGQVAEASSKARRSVQTVTLNAAKDAGSVTVAVVITRDDGTTVESADTLQVKTEGDGWCVVTGWAEQKRIDVLAADIDASLAKVAPALEGWNFDDAAAAIGDTETKLALLPESDARRSSFTSTLDLQRKALATMKADWVGGRWKVRTLTDAMTDEQNVFVVLQSLNGVPNVVGEDKPAMLGFRCQRGELDAYVSVEGMLDADWLYGSVNGQHRFGSDPAERFSGLASTDHHGVFLRNPRGWMAKFVAREADGWTVELPLYNRLPASVRFDLASAAKALQAIPADCK